VKIKKPFFKVANIWLITFFVKNLTFLYALYHYVIFTFINEHKNFHFFSAQDELFQITNCSPLRRAIFSDFWRNNRFKEKAAQNIEKRLSMKGLRYLFPVQKFVICTLSTLKITVPLCTNCTYVCKYTEHCWEIPGIRIEILELSRWCCPRQPTTYIGQNLP
jgi:hypothetical protein